MSSLFIFLTWILSLRLYHRYFNSSLRVTFFDVGQGDSILIQFPFGKTLMIDGGGMFGSSHRLERELFLELARSSILKLEVALLSHPDLDHAQGFIGLFSKLTVKEFWYHGAFLKSPPPLLRSLRTMAEMRGIAQKSIQQSFEFNWEGVFGRVLPPKITDGRDNNRSLVLFLDYRGCRFLFTGDMEKAGERWLSEQGLPPVTVLKVAHHGSRTSSDEKLLFSLSPHFAVISAGLGNRYGHPHPKILLRIKKAGATILRTDFHGYVRFIVDRTGKMTCENSWGSCGKMVCGRR